MLKSRNIGKFLLFYFNRFYKNWIQYSMLSILIDFFFQLFAASPRAEGDLPRWACAPAGQDHLLDWVRGAAQGRETPAAGLQGNVLESNPLPGRDRRLRSHPPRPRLPPQTHPSIIISFDIIQRQQEIEETITVHSASANRTFTN